MCLIVMSMQEMKKNHLPFWNGYIGKAKRNKSKNGSQEAQVPDYTLSFVCHTGSVTLGKLPIVGSLLLPL